jgi:protein-disulfide isomerase
MKLFVILILLFAAALAAAQKPDTNLATSTKLNFTVSSLSPEGQRLYNEQANEIAKARTDLLTEMAANTLLELEAGAQNVTSAQLLVGQRKKVPDPTDAEIQAVYDANRSAIGNKPVLEVRKQIVNFLRHDPEQKAINDYIESLKTKYKLTPGKDVNAAGLRPGDVLFTAGGKSVTVQEFETKNKVALYEAKADIADAIINDLTGSILSALVDVEAKAQNIDSTTYIGREVTDKLRDFTDQERFDLETALKDRLFAKYQVKILFKEPTPLVLAISPDDDPASGPATAPVTVIMFSDFQCPSCSRTHPVLKKVLDEFPGKVRFVVRDFPLVNIHEHAFDAAKAASAANAQGKFFEYIELLYTHQDALDLESLKKYAAQVNLNVKQFELDFNAEKTTAEIKKDMADGQSYGIGGTPTIYVNGVKVRQLTAEAFRDAITAALARGQKAAVAR